MITDTDVAIPSERTAPQPRAASPRPRRARAGVILRVLGMIAAWGLIAGLVGFNAWWYRRDTRPLADPRTIDGWIKRGDYARAESALREQLRRAPHEGPARMTLARILAARGDLLGCARELEQVPYWSPQRAEALFRSGQAYLTADRARDAEAKLLAVLDDDPLHPPTPACTTTPARSC